MEFKDWWKGPREVPQTEAAAQEEWDAAVAAARGVVRLHLSSTTMSLYSTQPECKAARDALERLLDDLDKLVD